MEKRKTMMKYHQINVTLDSGLSFMIKAKGEDVANVYEWLDGLSGVARYETITAVDPIRPHVTKKVEAKQTKITQARINAGLTQEDLADLLGVSRITEQRWEYGLVRLRADKLMRIAKVLNVEWTDLMEEPNVITIARAKAGMTQEEFAKALGVWTTQAQRWEYDYKRLPIDRLHQIAEVLNIDVNDLIDN